MRIVNLILVVMIVTCYSGLCDSSIVIGASLEQEIEGCHSMNDHNEELSENVKINSNNSEKDHSSCCLDSLTSGIDEITGMDIVGVYSVNPYYDFRQDETVKSTYSIKEHDPPDLLSLNSTYLI